MKRLTKRLITLLAIIGAVALVLALIGIGLRITGFNQPDQVGVTEQPTPTPTASATAAPAPSSVITSPVPSVKAGSARGCLGGNLVVPAVREAQEKAELSPEGAAEFAATYVRWLWQYPRMTGDDAARRQIVSRQAPSDFAHPDRVTRDTPRTEIYASFLAGRYQVVEFSPTSAKVMLVYNLVWNEPGQKPEQQKRISIDHLVVEDGLWKVAGASAPPLGDQVLANTQPFSGGC